VSGRGRLEGVIRGRGVAAISGLPGVRLTGVAADSSCLCIQQKGNNVMLKLYKNNQKKTPLTPSPSYTCFHSGNTTSHKEGSKIIKKICSSVRLFFSGLQWADLET
jgi:hypothetical protein